MGQASVRTPSLVRATVASHARRVDLVLPGAVPVAELLPELARSVGLLDAAAVHDGYRVVTAGGRVLVEDLGLAAQGVEDGALLTLAVGVDAVPPRPYDDIAEAMADAVERDLAPWSQTAGRWTALAGAGLLLALGAGALLLQPSHPHVGIVAAAVAAGLIAAAGVLSHVPRHRPAAAVVGWLGLLHAVVAASAFGAMGLLRRVTGHEPAVALTAVLTVLVLAGSLLPRLALAATGTSAGRHSGEPAQTRPTPIDQERVGADARLAHEILLGVVAVLGLLLALLTPLAVSLGSTGALLAALCCLVVMLRTRHHHAGAEVLAGLASGAAGLLSTVAAAWWLHPSWRPELTLGLSLGGALLLIVAVAPWSASVRRSRLVDLVEGAAVLALLPLLVVAVGLFSALRG